MATVLSPALVLYAERPAATRRFYEALGFVFRAERHGKGPRHVSGTLGGFVLEIYPRPSSTEIDRSACSHAQVRLAIPVPDAEAAVRAIAEACGSVAHQDGPKGSGIIRVEDPDRIIVLLLSQR